MNGAFRRRSIDESEVRFQFRSAHYNAGLQPDAPFQEMTLAQWNRVISVNLTGQFLCARAAIVKFLRRECVSKWLSSAGKIIRMSSVHHEIPWADHCNYAASKGSIMMLMKSIAQEFAPRRICVNSVARGTIRTTLNSAAWQTKEAYDALMTLAPHRRIGEPDDGGKAAVWLASDQADYVVGATLYVDGGITLFPGFATGR
jgi:glucose 1-dehydrogenase